VTESQLPPAKGATRIHKGEKRRKGLDNKRSNGWEGDKRCEGRGDVKEPCGIYDALVLKQI
jgi:hypothetical protein